MIINPAKSNDNAPFPRTYPRETSRIIPLADQREKRGIKWFARILALTLAALGATVLFLSWFAPRVLDRMEAAREYQANYNCAYYGDAMNKFYGRDVCEDPALHKNLLK